MVTRVAIANRGEAAMRFLNAAGEYRDESPESMLERFFSIWPARPAPAPAPALPTSPS